MTDTSEYIDPFTWVAVCAETPMASFGMETVSRPMAARLLGYNIKTLNKMLDGDSPLLGTTGNVQKRVNLTDVEKLRGSPLTLVEWLTITSSAFDGREPERCEAPAVYRAEVEKRRAVVRARHGDG